MSSSSIIKTLLLLLSATTSYAQSLTLSGKVMDAANQPVPFADVVLLMPQDSAVYKGILTNEEGHYEIKDVASGDYIIKFSFIGFEDHYEAVTITQNLVLPNIVLKEQVQQLGEVVINTKRPTVKRKVDRLEFDVENSILSSDNAWEIVTKTPGVTAAGDQLAIRGSSGILVTINDKRVYLTGTELKNLLENTNGDDIKSIEVITNPPARYEAQGSAVLNIKMKKTVAPGYKGSVAGAYVQSLYPKGVVSTNHYYRNKKLSATGGYMFGSGHYYGFNDTEVKYFNDNGSVNSVWRSREEANYKALAQNSYNLNIEYQIDSLNTVNVGGNGFSSLKSTANIVTPTYIYGADGGLDSLFVNNNTRHYPRKNSTFNALFEHKFNDKDRLTFSGDYTNYYFNQNQEVASEFSLPGEAPYRSTRIGSYDTRNIYLLSLQADYSAKKWGSNIEAGIRYGTVDAENDFTYADEGGVVNPGMSNRFLYNERIFAGYLSFDRELGKWSFKAGLRGEYTELEGLSATTNERNTQKYFKVFPTVYTLYKPDENNQIGLSYGKRIIRPQYGALNPFRSYNTPYSYSTGDPGLQPALAHNFSLLYTLKDKHNFDLYYRYEKDPSMEIIYQDYATSTLVQQVTNIKSNRSAGMEFNTNIDLFSWWNTALQTNAAYGENTFQGANGNLYTNDIFSFSGSTNNRFTLNKAKDLLAEANFFYSSPTVAGASEYGDISSLTLMLRKRFFNGDGELTLILSDIYKGQAQNVTTRYANQYSSSSVYGDTRSFRIQFRYRFGNQKLEGARTREQTDEQRRL
jgi:hypothetical protein